MRDHQIDLTGRVTAAEAAATGLLAVVNAVYFGGRWREASAPARRAAALALVLVNAAFAAEAAAYLAFLSAGDGAAHDIAIVTSRSLALIAVATLTALVWRREGGRPR
jgi:hypothetical protein